FTRTGDDPLLRAEIDDAAAGFVARFLGDHLLDRSFAPVEHACEIDAHDLLPLRIGGLQESCSRGNRSVVDHYVEATIASDSRRDQAVNLIPLPHVDVLEEAFTSRTADELERWLASFERLSGHVGERDPGPFTRVCQGDGAA